MSATDVESATGQRRLSSKDELATALGEAREQTRRLLAPLDAEALSAQHSELMSPLVWDLAHVGWYEEYWLLRQLGAETTDRGEFDEIYDAFANPRSDRPNLPLLDPDAAWAYCDEVRARALEHLDSLDLSAEERLLEDGYAYGLVIQHELQHNETMLQTLQLRTELYPLPKTSGVEQRGHEPVREVTFAGGTVAVGSDHAWAYDNEKPVTRRALGPFAIDVMPVTNAEFQSFIDDDGYATDNLWAPAGLDHIRAESIEAPLGWARSGSESWSRQRLGNVEAVPADDPVQHVSWFEADAFARWAGKRLPSELEWEAAASWDPRLARNTMYPWGDGYEPGNANLGCASFAPVRGGALPAGASPLGCEHMTGDVWEWTSSDFAGYDEFEPFPYPEYSEVFFGSEYKVLRGGSWATSPRVARASFRNWDFPQRRQLFAGFRCARDIV